MDIKAWNEINRAHERLDNLEKNPGLSEDGAKLKAAIDEFVKEFRGEIQGLKMRMGKKIGDPPHG